MSSLRQNIPAGTYGGRTPKGASCVVVVDPLSEDGSCFTARTQYRYTNFHFCPEESVYMVSSEGVNNSTEFSLKVSMIDVAAPNPRYKIRVQYAKGKIKTIALEISSLVGRLLPGPSAYICNM